MTTNHLLFKTFGPKIIFFGYWFVNDNGQQQDYYVYNDICQSRDVEKKQILVVGP